MKYTEEEFEKAKIAYEGALKVIENAINICKKHIENFKNDSEHEIDVRKIEEGLGVLEKGYNSTKIRGIEGIMGRLRKYPTPGLRPGLGLLRGFGELFWEGKPWEKEIKDSVRAIEHYFGYM